MTAPGHMCVYDVDDVEKFMNIESASSDVHFSHFTHGESKQVMHLLPKKKKISGKNVK